MGVRGTDSRTTWLPAETKQAILIVIATSQDQGVSARRSCAILAISHRRVVRWQARERQGLGLADGTPGPGKRCIGLLPEEIEQHCGDGQSQEYVDLSHRILAITAGEKGLFFASFSTVYRVLKARDLMTARGPGGRHNGHSLIPVRKELTGPNQRWCWDISYLLTLEKGVYLYLYLLLDEFSRKAIFWRISWTQTADGGPPAPRRRFGEGKHPGPAGRPAARTDQRPRPPDESQADPPALRGSPHAPIVCPPPNPQRQSVHRIRLLHRQTRSGISRPIPGRRPGRRLLRKYFDWYNHQHYHSGIDYVTPHQAHSGLRGKIVARRLSQQLAQRLRRRAANQRQIHPQQTPNHNPTAVALVV
jgi:putative transposase